MLGLNVAATAALIGTLTTRLNLIHKNPRNIISAITTYAKS